MFLPYLPVFALGVYGGQMQPGVFRGYPLTAPKGGTLVYTAPMQPSQSSVTVFH